LRNTDGDVMLVQAVGARRSVSMHHDSDAPTGSIVVISLD
jgi:hypothetical protein